MDLLLQTVCVFSEAIGMEFDKEVCYVSDREKKDCKIIWYRVAGCKLLHHYRKEKVNKYLGILEAARFLREEMKLKVSKEYFRRFGKVLKSKLNGGNIVEGVNTWAVSLSRYSAGFISWRICELQAKHRKIRKLFTMRGGLLLKSDVDTLHIPRENGGRGLIAIVDCAELAVTGLEVYAHESEERLMLLEEMR